MPSCTITTSTSTALLYRQTAQQQPFDACCCANVSNTSRSTPLRSTPCRVRLRRRLQQQGVVARSHSVREDHALHLARGRPVQLHALGGASLEGDVHRAVPAGMGLFGHWQLWIAQQGRQSQHTGARRVPGELQLLADGRLVRVHCMRERLLAATGFRPPRRRLRNVQQQTLRLQP